MAPAPRHGPRRARRSRLDAIPKGEQDATAALLAMLKDPAPEVRAAAAAALSRVGPYVVDSDSLIGPLRAALEDAEAAVRQCAARALETLTSGSRSAPGAAEADRHADVEVADREDDAGASPEGRSKTDRRPETRSNPRNR